MIMNKNERKINYWSHISLIATFFGVGRVPFAPGTWGSVAAYPFTILMLLAFVASLQLGVINEAWLMSVIKGRPLVLIAMLLLIIGIFFFIGAYAAKKYEKITGKSDPKEVVIDEVIGQFMVIIFTTIPCLILIPEQPNIYESSPNLYIFITIMLPFLLFRLFDIYKPWPISWVDLNIKNGIGIMLDDIIAGFMAITCYYVIFFQLMNFFSWLAK